MKQFRNILIVMLVLIITSLFLVSGCEKKEAETIKIGAILPLTGTASEIAAQHKMGIDFAVNEINAAGGINGKKLEIIYEDDQNDPKTTVSAFNKLNSINKVPVVLTVMSGSSMAVYPVAEKNKVILFANCGHPEIADLSTWVFRNFPSSTTEAERMISFLTQELKLKKLFVFYINDAYGEGAKKVIVKKFTEANGEIVGEEAYDKAGLDFKSLVQKMKEQKPEGVYVFGYGKATGLISKQIREMGYEGLLIGSYNFSVAPINEIASEALEEALFTSPIFNPKSQDENISKFVSAFQTRYHTPPPWNAVTEYDAIKIIASVIKDYGYGSDTLRDGLIKMKDFIGVAGDYQKRGDEWLPALTIKTYKNGNVVDYGK